MNSLKNSSVRSLKYLLYSILLVGGLLKASHNTTPHKRASLNFTAESTLYLNQLYFPKNFHWGFTIAEQQNSGADNLPNSNWTRFEQTKWPDGESHIIDDQTSGKACDHWNLYQTDIDLMKKDFNVSSFRFSIAWDRVEPEPGVFSEEALNHYSDEVDALLKAGIEPMISLHHFTMPIWFEDLGSFEKKENIGYFVRFSAKVFEKLGDRVKLWCTINEPTVLMFQGYLPLHCVFPPGKGRGIKGWATAWSLANTLLCNMMQAHTEVYRTLKSMPHGKEAQIGLVHQYLKFEAYRPYHPIESFPGLMVNSIMIDAVIDFLKTGRYDHGIGFNRRTYTAPVGSIGDFVGLNYYSCPHIKCTLFPWSVGSVPRAGEIMTDMPYAIYPQGMYYALHHMAEIGLPIYITENGIADRQNVNDYRRQIWISTYLKSVSLALEDGIDVRGFYYWTLVDNFEWDNGWKTPFGLYSLNRETQERTLKEGGKVYATIIKNARSGELSAHTSDMIVKA